MVIQVPNIQIREMLCLFTTPLTHLKFIHVISCFRKTLINILTHFSDPNCVLVSLHESNNQSHSLEGIIKIKI